MSEDKQKDMPFRKREKDDEYELVISGMNAGANCGVNGKLACK